MTNKIYHVSKFGMIKLSMLILSLLPISNAFSTDQILAVGIDRKFGYSDEAEAYVWKEGGHDEVLFFDIDNQLEPHLIGSVAVENSIFGPPTNIGITPDQKLAFIANSVSTTVDPDRDEHYAMKKSSFITVVDLTTNPIKVVSKIKVGGMPSGLSIAKSGKFMLVANRSDSTVSLLTIENTSVKLVDTVNVGGEVTAVAISPDGRNAFAVKNKQHKVAILNISESGKVTYTGDDIPVGLYPWGIAISQDGNQALVTNIGFKSASDGNADTVTIIDLVHSPARVSQHLTVGDAPEGIAISPNGKFSAVSLLAGSFAVPLQSWYRREVGALSILRITSDDASIITTIDVGSFPEGVAFSSDSKHIYVGNFASESLSIIKLNSNGEVESTKYFQLPGPPASLRVANQ
ncbi:MAG: YncE family protein [Oleispira sp.]|nr:YncE family protein [Oleispira sp.]